MNRVQAAFIGVFGFILAADVLLSFLLSWVQRSPFLPAARLVVGGSALLLFASGLLLAGSTPLSSRGMQNSPVLVTPNFGRLLRNDRADQARGVSELPVVGVLYGLFLMVVTFALYLLPG